VYQTFVQIRHEEQRSPVADPVEAKIAVMRPILASVLHSLGNEVVEALGYQARDLSRGNIPLHLLGRLRSEGDGDVGIAFEYAIHEAIRSGNQDVTERVADALKKCRIKEGAPASIFFAIEKSGSERLISTETDLITENSRALSGKQGQPIKLKNHLSVLAAAFRRPTTRPSLPQSIRGLWKADLFLGSSVPDHWVGTTVKTNPRHLEGATGLRIGIVPSKSGSSDAVTLDETRGLVICPVPHDGSYMQVFYETWRIAQVLMRTDFETPTESQLPSPEDREVARVFSQRRKFTIATVIEDTEAFAQPKLLATNVIEVSQQSLRHTSGPATSTLVVPQPLQD